MIRPGEVKNVSKTDKIEGYNTQFQTFSRPEFRTPQDPSRAMGGHCKGVKWLRTIIWMPLRSFRGNFGFYEK